MPTMNMKRTTPSWLSSRNAFHRLGGEEEGLSGRRERPQQRRPEQDAGDHLADHRRLIDAAAEGAEQAGGDDDDQDLEEQDRERVVEVLAQRPGEAGGCGGGSRRARGRGGRDGRGRGGLEVGAEAQDTQDPGPEEQDHDDVEGEVPRHSGSLESRCRRA